MWSLKMRVLGIRIETQFITHLLIYHHLLMSSSNCLLVYAMELPRPLASPVGNSVHYLDRPRLAPAIYY